MVNQLASLPVSQLNRQTNKELFAEAKKYLVGGVNSPVRAFKAIGKEPIFIKSAKGSRIFSEDGREFIDYCQSFGALVLGHSHPEVVRALEEAIKNGTTFGAPTKLETELAMVIIKAIPSIQKIRFTNSGTEAVMGAIRLARAFTKKKKLIKFKGAYHGHADYLLDCPGIPGDFTKYTLVTNYNDIKLTEDLIKKHKGDIAAIIVEPVAGNMGVVLPQEGFLQGLRNLADKYNIVLIFDEVITGFRLTYGAAQDLFGIKPDLTCLGKIIGGGLPIGAFGGAKKIMQLLAPEGPVYQAGTFSGNLVSVSAGLVTLRILSQENPYSRLEKLTRLLCGKIQQVASKYRIKLKVNFIGSMFSIFFSNKEITDYRTSTTQDLGLFRKFYCGLLDEGIYFAPSGFEANFISLAHSDSDLEKTQSSIDKTISHLQGGKW